MRGLERSLDLLQMVQLHWRAMRSGKPGTAFLSEVERVLRPGGHFLFADYRSRSKMEKLKPLLATMRLEPVIMEDVTAGILRGLDHDEARKKDLIVRMIPSFLRKTVSKFAGVGHGDRSEYAKFAMGHKVYIAAVFRRPEASLKLG